MALLRIDNRKNEHQMSQQEKVEKLANVTSEAMEKATGSSWQEWIDFLDSVSAEKMPHPKITRLLEEEHVHSNWWRQKIASGYRFFKGLRGDGQSGNMFQAGVQKVFPYSQQQLWDFVIAPEYAVIWNQGNLATDDFNVFSPPSTIRLKWRLKTWKKSAILQIRIMPKDDHSTLSLLLSGLDSEKQRNDLKKHLKAVIDQLYELAGSK